MAAGGLLLFRKDIKALGSQGVEERDDHKGEREIEEEMWGSGR